MSWTGSWNNNKLSNIVLGFRRLFPTQKSHRLITYDLIIDFWDNSFLQFFFHSFFAAAYMVRMWELDHKEGWTPKNWCFQAVMLEKTLESPLDCKEIKPVHSKGNQPWIFIGRTDGWSWSSNTLATWWEKLTHRKRPWCWETEDRRSRGRQRTRWLDGVTDSMDMS